MAEQCTVNLANTDTRSGLRKGVATHELPLFVKLKVFSEMPVKFSLGAGGVLINVCMYIFI